MNLQLKVPPALLLVKFLLLAWGISAFVSPDWMPHWTVPADNTVSGLLTVLGVVIIVAGVIEFRHHRTTVNPLSPSDASAVVRSGIFRLSRNPMYLGMLLILMAAVVKMLNLLTLFLPVLFVLYMNRFQIVPEEKILTAQFGQEYRDYLDAVRRWL